MKFSQLGLLTLASAVSAALVLGVTACGESNTVDYLYIASANATTGEIYAYAVDGESGTLSTVLGSPFPAGRNPIALVTTPDDKTVYALNHDDNTVIQYAVGPDGKLYSQNTYNIKQGTNPNGMAISPDGKTLYVAAGYGLAADGTPYSATTPGPGALIQFPVNSNYTLGAETAYATCNNPVAVNVLANGSAVYVVNDPSGQLTTLIDTMATENRGATGSATVIYPAVGGCFGGAGAQGQINSYIIGSGNVLTPGTGSPFATGAAAPSAIAGDTKSRALYVTDFATNLMYSYAVQSNGELASLTNPESTGNSPSALTVDPNGDHIYVANYVDNTVSGFAIDPNTGAPSALAGNPNVSGVGSGPASVLVEDAFDRYVYTANFVSGTVSSLYLDQNAGTMHTGQSSPFSGVAKATALASVKHGHHTP